MCIRDFMNIYKCERSGKEFNSYDSLRRSVGRNYKIKSTDFYVEFYLGGVYPICKCGCGERVNWYPEQKRFHEYKHGHHSRVKNNWGHNQKAIDASAETRRRQYANGDRKVWNDGLSKETDERVKNNSISSKNTINSNPIELKNRSDRMRTNRLNGIIPTLSGKDNSQWKGGISPINCMVRSDKRLYSEWKYPILKRDGFQCVKCKSTDELQVHHNVETMSEIIRKIVPCDLEESISFEEKLNWCDKIVNYHIDNNVSGETLCLICHCEIHPSLNFNYTR